MSTTTCSFKKSIKKKRPLTTVDTDDYCFQQQSPVVSKFLYHLSLWNGLYMCNRKERLAFSMATWLVTIIAGLYLTIFFQGFVDGMQQQQQEASSSTSSSSSNTCAGMIMPVEEEPLPLEGL